MRNPLANTRYCFLLFMLLSKPSFAMVPVIDAAAIAQLGNQLAELKMQTQSMQQTLQPLSGNQYQWSNTQLFMNQLHGAMQTSQGMAYNQERLSEQFQRAYPGYQTPDQFHQQYQTNVNSTQQTFSGVMQSLSLHAAHFQDENNRLSFLQQQAQNARGQTQAIQVSTQIASEMVSQQQLLRQTVMAQSNAQTAYYATQVQNDASSRAELESVIHRGSKQIPAYGSSGEPLASPEF
jgi:type IV secretion system protein TrbJ